MARSVIARGARRIAVSTAGAYVLAVVGPLAVVAIKSAVASLGAPAPFLLLSLPIVLASVWGGLAPGLLTLLVEGTVAAPLFLPPPGSLLLERPEQWIALAAFVVEGGIVALVSSHVRRLNLAAARTNLELVASQRVAQEARAATERLARDDAAERERLPQVVELLPVGVTVIDAGGRVLLRNAASKELFGGSHAIEGRSDEVELARPDGASLALDELPLIRATRGETVRAEPFLVRGTRRAEAQVLVTAAPLHAPDGSITGAVSVVQDVTELTEMERSRTRFLAIAGHEMKTPITAIGGRLQLARRLIERGRSDDAAVQLERAQQNVAHMTELMEDLLDATRVLTLEQRPRARTDLVAVAHEAVARMRDATGRAEVALTAPDAPVWVTADPRRLGEVVENLVGNALKYSDAGTPVSVDVSVSSGASRPEAVVRVRDRGMGVSSRDREHLFEPFFRGERTETIDGTGLGLYLGREIATRHGGRLVLESSGEDGTTFALVIPIERRARQRD